MNPSKFFPSLADVEKLLGGLGLLADSIKRPNYPEDMPATIRQNPYAEGWRLSIRNRWYNFRLEDSSVLQFRITPYPSYTYLQCPASIATFEQYALRYYGTDWKHFYSDILEEYEQLIDSVPLDKPVTPIRYDYDTECYKPGIHPAAHMHLGLDNDIRILLEKQLTPLSFSMFIIRQFYPNEWLNFILKPSKVHFLNEIRNELSQVPKKYFNKLDLHEMRLV